MKEPYDPPRITYEAPLVVYCGILEPACGGQRDPWDWELEE